MKSELVRLVVPLSFFLKGPTKPALRLLSLLQTDSITAKNVMRTRYASSGRVSVRNNVNRQGGTHSEYRACLVGTS